MVSKLSQCNQEARDVGEGLIHLDLPLVTHHQPAGVADPGDAAFDFPAALVPPKLPAVPRRGLDPVGLVRADQVDATLLEPPTQRVAVRGLADARPFFAGAKPPSANVSSQSSRPCSSNSPRNARPIESHTSASSRSRSRRQHVLGEGYRSGRPFQRAPLRKTQRMLSEHRRRRCVCVRPWARRSLTCESKSTMTTLDWWRKPWPKAGPRMSRLTCNL